MAAYIMNETSVPCTWEHDRWFVSLFFLFATVLFNGIVCLFYFKKTNLGNTLPSKNIAEAMSFSAYKVLYQVLFKFLSGALRYWISRSHGLKFGLTLTDL